MLGGFAPKMGASVCLDPTNPFADQYCYCNVSWQLVYIFIILFFPIIYHCEKSNSFQLNDKQGKCSQNNHQPVYDQICNKQINIIFYRIARNIMIENLVTYYEYRSPAITLKNIIYTDAPCYHPTS